LLRLCVTKGVTMKAEFRVTYFLWVARKDKDGLAPVYIRSKQNAKEAIPFNTDVKMHPQQWDKKRNEPKNKPARLLELETKLKATYRDLAAQGLRPNLNDLVANMDGYKKPTTLSVVAWCEDYQLANYSAGMRKAVGTLKTNIQGFQPGLTFDRINKQTLRSFFDYLTRKSVANNSQRKRLTSLVNVAQHANVDIPDLTNYKLPYSTKNAFKVRLTWQEVEAVMQTPVASAIEEAAKEVFLLACFSGLRISDILTIQKGELHNYHYSRIQTKSKKPVLITLHKYNVERFRKFHASGVHYSRQRLSDALKDVLRRAGTLKPEPLRQDWAILRGGSFAPSLTKQVTKYVQIGTQHEELTTLKYKEISFHSGRRFYARLLNDLGLGEEIARDELGHSYRSVTELYAGSQEHVHRVARVRKAFEGLEERMQVLATLQA
jgi:integrase